MNPAEFLRTSREIFQTIDVFIDRDDNQILGSLEVLRWDDSGALRSAKKPSGFHLPSMFLPEPAKYRPEGSLDDVLFLEIIHLNRK